MNRPPAEACASPGAGQTGRQRLVLLLCGLVLYGVLNYLLRSLRVPGSAEVISLRPQIIIPILSGICLGPAQGFACGLFGNLLGDLLCGLWFTYWPWSLANGFIGAIPAFCCRGAHRRIATVSEFGLMIVLVIAGNVTGLGVGFGLDALMGGRGTIWSFFLSALLCNVYVALFLLPIALLALRKIRLTLETRAALPLFYLLLCSTLTVLFLVGKISENSLASLVKPLVEPTTYTALLDGFNIRLVRFAGIATLCVLCAGLLTAANFTRRILNPLTRLIQAAKALSDGNFQPGMLEPVAKREDELGLLAEVFAHMAQQVQTREQALKQRIVELEIVIDRQEENERLTVITENEYFKQLEQQAQALRTRKGRKRTDPHAGE
ncbi:MAG: hypothetical protein BWK76_24465 [Desulfobulbaceae bacterium A2]|nr:MAG: hypothetical protein BWK76_24465 [Desulfobulbaceae bacterium A2]